LVLLEAHHILHVSRIRVKEKRACFKLMEEHQIALFGELALDEALDLS